MSTYAVLEFPIEELSLADTMQELSDVHCHLEQNAMGKPDHRLHLWISCQELSTIADALEADASVRDFTCLQGVDDKHLYQITLESEINLPRRIIHRHDGTIREIYSTGDTWTFEVRFPEREDLSTADELFDSYDIEVFYPSVTSESSSAEDDLNKLTDDQREAIEKACELGYFNVPRDTTQEDVATALGVSHQALSERFRRAHQTLAKNHLESGQRSSPSPPSNDSLTTR